MASSCATPNIGFSALADIRPNEDANDFTDTPTAPEIAAIYVQTLAAPERLMYAKKRPLLRARSRRKGLTSLGMDVVELIPGLHFLRFPVGHAYLWHEPGGLALIDTSGPGSAPLIADAISQAGHRPADLRCLVLTHFHVDHAGAAADIAAWGRVEVLAHHADAPYLRGPGSGPPPDLADWERPIYDQVMRQAPAKRAAPVRVDHELGDGDNLGFGVVVTVHVPGHTPGSSAFYFPGPRVLIAGDAAARRSDGEVTPGVFNTDRAQAAASFRRLADLEPLVVCFGHGEPITENARDTFVPAD
jgi:glyoxylase-like metal-dependent hydrolase (beta-lactamase superfamily II)